MISNKMQTILKKFDQQNLSYPEIYMQLKIRRGILQDTVDGKHMAYILPSFDSRIGQIEQFMRYVQRTDALPYAINQHITVLDKTIHYALSRVFNWMHEFNPCFRYSPHVEAFFTITTTFPGFFDSGSLPLHKYSSKITAHTMNDYITALRDLMKNRTFKDKIRHKEENSKRSFVSSTQYVDRLFDKYKRMVVLRMDFYLSRQDSNQAEPLELLLHHFSALRSFMKRRVGVFQHLVGYIAHMEYGEEKGHHIHAIFFFNGDKVRSSFSLSKLIAAQWADLTNGIGRYFNTQEKMGQYQCKAIGMIARDDKEMRQCLTYVLWYITKFDQLLTYKYEDKQRLFFRGESPGVDKR